MQRRAWLPWGFIFLFLLWLFYSLSAYYVVQKPFNPATAVWLAQNLGAWARLKFLPAAFGRTLLDVALVVWLAWTALGTGLWLLSRFKLLQISTLDTGLAGLGLGFGALGLGMFFLGLAGLLQTAVLWTFPLLLTLITLPRTARFLRTIQLKKPPALAAVYIGLVLFFAATMALLPPTSWDALFYHLKGPKLYLSAGAIRPGVDIPHLSFPGLMEMLYMLVMGLRGDTAVSLLHLVFGVMLAGQIVSLAGRVGVKHRGTAVWFFLAMPMVPALAAWAYNDLALAFFQAAALAAALRGLEMSEQEAGRRWLALAGGMAGLAMGLKYTSFVAPVTIALLLIWEKLGRGRPFSRATFIPLFADLFNFALPALLVALPWYLKNWSFTGNPVYPFVFGGQFWDGFRADAYAGTGTGLGLDLAALLRLPHDLTLGLGDASQDGPTGPFFLIFLPVLLWLGRRHWGNRPLRWLLVFSLAQYVFWMVGVIFSAGLWQSRLLLPGLAVLCPVLALSWQELAQFDRPQFSLHHFLGLTLGVALVLNLVGQAVNWLPRAPLAFLLGIDGREQVLQRDLGAHFAAMQVINEQTPADAVIQFLYEPRSYYCDRDCRPDSILDTFAHLEYLHSDAAGIANTWLEAGVTHVLIFDIGLNFVIADQTPFVAPADTAVLDDLRQNYLQPVADVGQAYTLFAVKNNQPATANIPSLTACVSE